MTAADLTLDFPPHHQGRRNLRGVTFARTAQLYIVQRHEDNEENKVARHELWYTKSEYDRMNLSVKEDVIKLHAKAVEGDPFDYSGDCDDDASSNKSSVCCVGIEHLLSLACVLDRGKGLQKKMHPCCYCRADETGSIFEVEMGGHRTCLACYDKEGRN